MGGKWEKSAQQKAEKLRVKKNARRQWTSAGKTKFEKVKPKGKNNGREKIGPGN